MNQRSHLLLTCLLGLVAVYGFPTGNLVAAELTPTYLPSSDNYPTPNRSEAEQEIWNREGWPGSELATPLYTEAVTGGFRTLYKVRPEYVPKVEYYSPIAFTGASTNCSDCPIYDQFGNQRCSAGQFQYCANESALDAAIQNQFGSGSYCDWYVESQTPWEFSQYTGAGPALPDGTQIYGTKHLKFFVIRYWYNNGWCINPPDEYGTWNWGANAYSWTSCPTGYYDASTNAPEIGPACGNHFGAYLWEYNPIEPVQSCPVGNPCHPSSGAKSLTESDFESPTLPLTRAWNSVDKYKNFAAMGRGWTHNYSQRIMTYVGTSPPIKKLLDGDGTIEYFECTDSPTCSNYRSRKNPGWVLRPDGAGGWELLTSGAERRVFDGGGKLREIEQLGNNYRRVVISYSSGRVDQVVDQSGRSLIFNYNADGLVGSVTLPNGNSIGFEYKQPASIPSHVTWQQQLVKVTREDLTERNYHYEDQHPDTSPRFEFLLTGITDENNVRYATYTYDGSARVTSSEHAGGAGLVTLNYTKRAGESENWTITEVTTPLGEVVTYDMNPDPFRKVTGIADSRGIVTNSYDPTTTWRTSRTDREGNQTTYEYADGLHETRRTEAVGTLDERIIETDWDSTINRIQERRAPGKTTRYTHNTRGQVLTRTETDTTTLATRTWTYTYFEAPSIPELIGKLASMDGPRTDVSDVTSYDYYTSDDPGGAFLKGDLHTITNALGHVTECLAYDGNGRPLQIKDANNVTTTMTYHARGWISSRTTDGQITTFAYDNAGNLTRVTLPDGSYTSYEYDDARRLEAIADNFNNRIEYALDADGNRTAEQTYNDLGVLRRQMSRVYDQLGRLQKLIDGNLDETTYAYDNNGNRTSSQDANLNSTSFEYDSLDRLVKAIDASLGQTLMTFDERDNLTTVADPMGNVTTYSYDGLDNQSQLDSPDTGITVYEYDDAGNRTAATDARSVRVEYAYDALNRLTMVDYADNSLDVTFTYDVGANGKERLTSMTDAAGTETYSYDARGNLINVSRDINGTNYSTSYAYNGADRLMQITYPSGMAVDYTLDAAGRVVAVDKSIGGTSENLVTGVEYEPFGPVSDFTFGNGLKMGAVFDQDYELDTLQSGALDWVFDYDATGNILSISDQAIPANSQLFTYDDLYRLDTAQGGYGAEGFDYDANGNRTRYISDVVDDPYTYEPQSSRLAMQNGWSLKRDPAGNRLSKLNALGHGQLYSYGDHNRLALVTGRDGTGDTVVGTYVYDGRGQRVSKTANGVTTNFVYGLNGELLGEYVGGTTPDVEYVFLNGQPVAIVSSKYEQITPPPQIFIIDNDDPGTSNNGTWKRKTDAQTYGPDHRLGKGKKKASATYRWTVNYDPSFYADVEARWVDHNSHSGDVDYTIMHAGGATVFNTSQKSGGGQWNAMGGFLGISYVEVSAANGKTSADAVRFVSQAPPGSPVLVEVVGFIHTDHLGTPRRVSDDLQSTVWSWDSTPFGEGAPNEDPDGDSNDFVLNLRFPGQYYDAESGLNYNYFRYYDASTGRYLEGDPIGLHGGLNPYSYTLNSPLVSSDSLGLYTSARWLSGPSLGGISREKIGEMGFGEYWTLIPPAIGFGGTWWMIKAQISGVVECIDEEECGEHRRDVFNVKVDLGKRVGIGYGITTYPWFQAGRKAAEALSSINHAIEVYRNEWTQMAIDMARNPMASCFIMSVAGPGK